MDKAFIKDIVVIQFELCLDPENIDMYQGATGMGFGLEDDEPLSDEQMLFLKVLTQPRSEKFAIEIADCMVAANVKDEIIDLVWTYDLQDGELTLDCGIVENAEPTQNLYSITPIMKKLSTDMFADIMEELDSVVGVMHQRITPTFRLRLSKEVQVA